jgi:hypothetical protein
MRRALSAAAVSVILLIGFVRSAPAQVAPACFDCVIGLYDDPARTSAIGTSTPGTVKSIYLGIDYAPGVTGLLGMEFSIHGMRSDTDGILVGAIEWVVPPTVVLGPSLIAPADTSATSMGVGGQTLAWQQCQVGSRTLARIDFLHFMPLVNKVFKIMRKFPQSNPPAYQGRPVIVLCDPPTFTSVRVSGSCYILNWNGDPNVLSCIDAPIGIEQRAWSSVKALYR